MEKLTSADLKYIRCKDCLSTYTASKSQIEEVFPCPFFCSCGGEIKILGNVTHESEHKDDDGTYESTRKRAICDGKCTHAVGPVCNCICCGKYHGTGLVVTVVVDKGIIRIQEIDAKAIERAEEWRKIKGLIENILSSKFSNISQYLKTRTKPAGWVYSWEESRAYSVAQKEMGKMANAHLHTRRMNLANAFLIKYGPKELVF